jgi:hypothetical protein
MTIYAHNNLFIQNKYHDWYYQIIDNARLKTYDGYSEVHHIIPGSLGGSGDPSNLVRLSYPEHFLCHWLLIKFVSDPKDKAKMAYALQRMTSIRNDLAGKRIVASWQFEVVKRAAKDNMSGENHPNYGRKHYNNGIKAIQLSDDKEVPKGFVLGGLPKSEEHRLKMSAIRMIGENHPSYGRKHYNNGTKSIMLSYDEEITEGFVLGRLPTSDETRRNMSDKKWYNNGTKSIKLSDGEEIPEGFLPGMLPKQSDNMSGKKWYNNGTKSIRLSDDQEIPEGFVLGRLPTSDETRRKLSGRNRGSKFYNNGTKNIMISEGEEIPEDFVLGRIFKNRTS